MSFVGTDIKLYFHGFSPLYGRPSREDLLFRQWVKEITSKESVKTSIEPIKMGLFETTGPVNPTPFCERRNLNWEVIRSINIGDGGVYTSAEPLIKIDPANGRKTRKKDMFTFYNQDGKYLKANMYFGDKTQMNADFGRNMLICVRLNDMFMFWQAQYVQSQRLKTKAIVVDFDTNIKPYEEEQYPVTKTREDLQTNAANIIRELTGVMDTGYCSSS